MNTLKTYIAIVPTEFTDQFYTILDRIGHQSNIRQGNRLSTIIPMRENVTYEVALSDDEAIVLKLSCPGIYAYYTEKKITESMIEYTADKR